MTGHPTAPPPGPPTSPWLFDGPLTASPDAPFSGHHDGTPDARRDAPRDAHLRQEALSAPDGHPGGDGRLDACRGGLGAARGDGLVPARSGAPSAWGVPDAVLFDRDGTLVVDVPYNGDPGRVELMSLVREAVDVVRGFGIPVGVVSNQSGVARGMLTRGQVEAVQQRVEALLGPFAVWAVCPHGPDDGCGCRKPAPGLVLAACERLGVSAARTVVIGDIGSDVAAARAAGARGVLVPTSVTRPEETEAAEAADGTAADLLAAARLALSPDALEGGRSRSPHLNHVGAASPGGAHPADATGQTARGPR